MKKMITVVKVSDLEVLRKRHRDRYALEFPSRGASEHLYKAEAFVEAQRRPNLLIEEKEQS